MPSRTARLFNNGGSQAVRLPAEFRFEGNEVFVRRDEKTGDVILSRKSGAKSWSEYLAARDGAGVSADFMAERPLNTPLTERALFDNES